MSDSIQKNGENGNLIWSRSNQIKSFSVSLLSLFLFLVPVPYNQQWTIAIGILAEWLQVQFENQLPFFMTIVLLVSIIMTIGAKTISLRKPEAMSSYPFFEELFNVGWSWVILRLIGAVFAALTLWEIGPEFIWSSTTGGTVLYSLVPVLTTWFLIAGFFYAFITSIRTDGVYWYNVKSADETAVHTSRTLIN